MCPGCNYHFQFCRDYTNVYVVCSLLIAERMLPPTGKNKSSHSKTFANLNYFIKKKMKGDPTNSPEISSGILALTSEIHNYNTRVNLNIHRQSVSINHSATTFLLQY